MLKQLNPSDKVLLSCVLLKTTKRITFQITNQSQEVTNLDESSIISFTASNGYEVISEHRMDIQSRRIWLFGASNDQPADRSGTMAVPTRRMTDEAFPEYEKALLEWAVYNQGTVLLEVKDYTC